MGRQRAWVAPSTVGLDGTSGIHMILGLVYKHLARVHNRGVRGCSRGVGWGRGDIGRTVAWPDDDRVEAARGGALQGKSEK